MCDLNLSRPGLSHGLLGAGALEPGGRRGCPRMATPSSSPPPPADPSGRGRGGDKPAATPCGAGGAGSAMRVQGARLGAQLSLGERPPGARSRGGAPCFTEEDTACKGFTTLVSLQRTGSGPAENPRLQGGLQSLGDVQVTPAQLGPVRTPTAFFAQAACNTRCWICRCHTLGLPVPVGWVLVEGVC